ncbi:Suppressor protein STM1 [Wickerhamomyces ciferrii]|uniref:Suppressor protein STM1 n=1 Tax=Wickerhamomyces ciferrii (strain ATCC 14091 / BCRC 22168 / CBS 111 / JCM 3599 / NBRC 0793 / NRRL Y-1031 F-60-10) TaxID=1206466 RepID=K0KXU7_WICCF|nr:Suppressor protein STM1 [Wickerhamomyces ciferrii]CCH46882.1 Suppressor protein STM1 [Wickerhamomyces ciferrii]
MSNPFDVLGNDIEEADASFKAPREIVKKNTSSKKTDTAPPSANKDRANKNRPQATGNEAALKAGKAGREANKAKGVEEPVRSKKPVKGGKTDRHSRSGKTDSDKRVKQAGWTADGEAELENELDGAEDAAEELKEEDNKPAKKSLEDFLKEQEAALGVNSARNVRQVQSSGDDEVIAKQEEVFIAPTKTKNVKSKALKTKQFLDFDATFADEAPRPQSTRGNNTRGGRGPRGNTRGRGPRGGNNTRGPKGPKQASGPSINDEANFPSLA